MEHVFPSKQLTWELIGSLCARFEKSWTDGEIPHIEDYLELVVESVQPLLLAELLRREVYFRLRAGEDPARQDYDTRFPAYETELDAVFHDDGILTRQIDGQRLGTTMLAPGDEPQAPSFGQTFFPGDPEGLAPPGPALGKFGDYDLLKQLGRGGMGVVYLARQISADRIVAVKVIRRDRLGGENDPAWRETVERFRVETKAAARLHHENLVTVYDVGEIDGRPFYSMRYIKGQSLRKLLEAGPVANRRAAEILRDVSRGLHAAHQHGILHRDLKPDNILIESATGRAMVADFGLAKIGEEGGGTLTGVGIGTPQYMPPEQAEDASRATVTSDVYSLGATLYCLLTGQPPFPGELYDVLRKLKEAPPAPPRSINPRCHVDLETLCLKCLEKDPTNRLPSAEAMADELERFLDGRPIQSRPVNDLVHAWRWCRRNPVGLGLLLASMLVVVLFGAGWWFRQQSLAASQLAEEKQKLADTERYFSLVNDLRENRATTPRGWTWAAEGKLEEAALLNVKDRNPTELRTLAAAVHSRFDLRLAQVLKDVPAPGTLAINPQGTRLAVGHLKGVPEAWISVYELNQPNPESSAARLLGNYSFKTFWGNLDRFFGGDSRRFQERITRMAFDPQGRWLVAGTLYGYHHVWDLARPGEPVHSWNVDDNPIRDVAFTPDGRFLISISQGESSGRIFRWDCHHHWSMAGSIDRQAQSLTLTPDEKFLAVTDNHGLTFCDVETLQPTVVPASIPGNSQRVAFASHGRLLLRGGTLIDPRDGTVCRVLRDPEGDEFSVDHGGFAADGSLVYGSCSDWFARVWDTASGTLLAKVSSGDRREPPVVMTPDGRWLAVSTHGETRLYEIHRSLVEETVGLTAWEVQDLAFSAQGGHLRILIEKLAAKQHTSWGSVVMEHCIKDSRTRRLPPPCVTSPQHTGVFALRNTKELSLPRIAIDPMTDRTAVLDPLLGPCVWDPTLQRWMPCARSDGTQAVVIQQDRFRQTDGKPAILVEDPLAADVIAALLTSGQSLLCDLPGNVFPKHESYVAFLALRSQVKISEVRVTLALPKKRRQEFKMTLPADCGNGYLSCLSHSESAAGKNSPGQLEVHLPEANGQVFVDAVMLVPTDKEAGKHLTTLTKALAFAPDGGRLWGLYFEETLTGWQSPDWRFAGQTTHAFESKVYGGREYYSLAVGRSCVLLGSREGTAYVHSAQDGQRLSANDSFGSTVGAVAISPAGNLAALGTEEGRLFLAKIPKLSILTELPSHRLAVRTLAFSGDGQLLVSGSKDRFVRLWERGEDGYQERLTLGPFFGPIQRVALRPDGTKLAILIQGERAVRLWHLDRLQAKLSPIGL